ncbi:MAG: protein-export chaperone SecB [Alphaproteobacteria bacterium]|nr:MAG: protein-export chaperone SecB [Alphaproteobacteria bacterium]
MSDNGQDAAGGDEAKQPSLAIIRQYVKDFSFENPNAPDSLAPDAPQPEVSLAANIQARLRVEEHYDVELRIEVKANQGEHTAFVIELVYGGLFLLKDFPDDAIEPICMIECPRLLFPFARRIIADATRDGGYAPLMLDPLDFGAMFRDHKAQILAQQQPAGMA